MSLLTDLRPFARTMRLGYQTLNAIFGNAFALESLLKTEHDEDTGEHATRKVAVASGTYRLSGSKWDLVGGVGPLPAVGTRLTAGECTLSFGSAMGDTADDYDVQITAEDTTSEGVIVNYRSKTVGSVVVVMRNGATNAKVDANFSIEIKRKF